MIGAFWKFGEVGFDVNRATEILVRCENLRLRRVHFDRVESHSPAVDSPFVHVDSVELRSDARFEDLLMQGEWNAVSIVEHRELASVPVASYRKENGAGMGVSCVAKQLDNDVLGRSDVVGSLASLRFGRAKTNEAIP